MWSELVYFEKSKPIGPCNDWFITKINMLKNKIKLYTLKCFFISLKKRNYIFLY
jgi:hypothetical protein